MPAILYGKGAYRRDNGNLPELKLVNMFLEQAPTAEAGVTLLSRQGLAIAEAHGNGPIHALFAASGVFGQDLFTLSGSFLYRGASVAGGVAGTGPASIAASPSSLLIARGAAPHRYDGTAVAAEAFPDGAGVTAVAFLAEYFIAIRAGSHRFYWRRFDVPTWDALDYASAESARDDLLDVKVIQDGLWLIGAETVEFWAITGNAETPFTRVESRLYRKGVIKTGCAAEVDNTLFWWGNDNSIYRGTEVPQKISDSGIDERLARSTVIREAFAFNSEGHSFFCVRTDEGTFAFDASTSSWCEFGSFGRTNWRVRNVAVAIAGLVFGDDINGTVWRFGGWDDGSTLERRMTSAFPLTGGSATVNNMLVTANVGQVPDLAMAPGMEVRSSRDGGQTWGEWRAANLGRQGEYRSRTIWRRMGMFDPPGAMFDHRVTDPVPLRVSGVAVNEALGGRARGA